MVPGESEYEKAKGLHEQHLYDEAAEYLKKSVDLEYIPAIRSLGIYYLRAYIKRDTVKGISLLERAAQSGDIKAQLQLANFYYHEDGEGNKAKSYKWAKMAADNGSEDAQEFVANCLSDGVGVDKDDNLALEYYKKAALQGNELGQRKLLTGNYGQSFDRLDDFLYDAYANLQMLMYAFHSHLTKFDTKCYMIRAKAKKAYKEGKWKIHDLMTNNVYKMKAGNYCWYCGMKVDSKDCLTIDHIFPRSKGGSNSFDNIVLVCKHCNSSKSDTDVLEWFVETRKQFPPIYVIVHHLKEINIYAEENSLMEKSSKELDEMKLPFNWRYIPVSYNLYNGEK